MPIVGCVLISRSRLLIAALVLNCVVADISFALDPSRTVYQYNCSSWTRQNGFPAGGVKGIAQSGDGYLWLGTSLGLVRFDGIDFQLHDPSASASIPGCSVQAVASGAKGIWFGLDTASFGSLEDKVFKYWGKADWTGLNVSVHAISENQAGEVWIGTPTHAARLTKDGKYTRVFPTGNGEGAKEIWTVYQDSKQRVWFGTTAQGLYYWKDGVVSKFPDPDLDTLIVYAIAEDKQGQIWVGTEKGLRCYDASFKRLSRPWPWYPVAAICADREGTVWVGTSGGGLARFKQNAESYLRKADGLADDSVLSIMEDAEGSLWVGTKNGLSQITDVKIPTYSRTEGFGEVDVAVSASRKGGVWIASGAGYIYFDGYAYTSGTNVGLHDAYISEPVYEARNGDLYVLNGAHQIEIVSGGRVVTTHSCKDWPTALCEDSRSVIAAVGSKLYRVGTNLFAPYTLSDGSQPDLEYVFNMITARDGSLWIAASGGVLQITEHGVQRFAPGGTQWICQDGEGTIWAGQSGGIVRVKDAKAAVISSDRGLPDNTINAMVLDDAGRFWVQSIKGIFQVSRDQLNGVADGRLPRVECRRFDTFSAVKSSERSPEQKPSGCRTPDGRIWFPTAQGVVVIDPGNISVNPVAPRVHIDRVLADGKDVNVSRAAVVGPGRGELEFHYVGLSLAAPKQVTYRYRLMGYDKDWVDAGNRRAAFYTNLKPGSYEFQVVASNEDGVTSSDDVHFAVTFRPHYYQTAWFYTSVALVVATGLAGMYRWRVRHLRLQQERLKQANELLETRVGERTAELKSEVEERKRAQEQLSFERYLFRALLDSGPDVIYFKDRQSCFIRCSAALARRCGVESPDALVGKSDFDIFTEEHARAAFEDEQEMLRTGNPVMNRVEKETWPDGHVTWAMSFKMPYRNQNGEIVGTFGISKDITAIKEAEAKLEIVHSQLLEASRKAGQADVAANVLHNVGNVLNSINVSIALITDRLRSDLPEKFIKAVAMLRQNEPDLLTYIRKDPRGSNLLPFLEEAGRRFRELQDKSLAEASTLAANVQHVNEIIAMQQNYANASGVIEKIEVTELADNALKMHSAPYARHSIEVVRKYEPVPPIHVDKHKVMEILVNLLQNSKHACDEGREAAKTVTVTVRKNHGNMVHLEVRDNGIGIAPENLVRIFNHGFTTRKNGHGFGLHGSALAAKQLGGALTAFSDGVGHGARFVLELPMTPPPAR